MIVIRVDCGERRLKVRVVSVSAKLGVATRARAFSRLAVASRPGRTRARVDARARRERRKSARNERESIVRARREVSRVPRTRERAGIVCGAR